MDTLTILLLVVIALLALALATVVWYMLRIHRQVDSLLEQGKIKTFKDVFLAQKERHADLTDQLQKAFERIKELEDISKITIQKTGVVRFNPFNEMGGNQSFVISLLDKKNNGFVISSLFVKDGNRVYAKQVKDGKSDYLLSKEETQAIAKAMKK